MKNIIKNNQAFSLMELLVVIGIMVILTSATIASIHFNRHQKVRQLSEMVASDIRLVRNMVTSRVVNPTFGAYPPGGYGMVMYAVGSTENSYYTIFAESGDSDGYQAGQDVEVKTVVFDEPRYRIMDRNNPEDFEWSFYFTFLDEHSSVDNMMFHPEQKFLVLVADPYPGYPYRHGATGYAGTIIVGELDEQGYTWSNLGTTYSSYKAPRPGSGSVPIKPEGNN